jgi:predicted nucleic acid-binding protein
MIHLDTSFLIQALRSGSPQEERLLGWLAGTEPVLVSSIVWAEFRCGPAGDEVVELARTLLGQPVALGAKEAERAAELFNASGRGRGSLFDCLVAASALEAGARLATGNVRDFERFRSAGLELA